jgi:hypothetical protein
MSSSSNDPAQVWADRSHPIQEDMKFQRATWRVERLGWVVLCCLVGLALLGLFATGPLSSTTVTDGTGRLQVEYGRFERYGAATGMQLRFEAEPGQEAAVRVNPSFMRSFNIESVSPRPLEERSGPDGVEMVFGAAAAGPVQVYFGLRPDKVGLVRSEIAIPGESPARFTQFVFP